MFAGAGILAGFLAVTLEAENRDCWIRTMALYGMAGIGALVGARLLWAVGSPVGPLRGTTRWAAMVDPGVAGFWSIGGFVGGGVIAVAAADGMADGEGTALLDGVVPAGLWTLAVARLGCLSAGCDYGSPTDLPWGLRYAAETPAWHAHVAQGLVDTSARLSAPTHPFPIYMVVVIAAAIAIGSLVSRRSGLPTRESGSGTPAGQRAFAVLLCYFSGRFAMEFFRGAESRLELPGTAFTVGQLFSAGSVALLVSVWWSRVGSE